MDNPISDSKYYRGCGGQRFKIKFIETGEIVETNDLRCNGEVPEEFRDQLPDNAEFIEK